MTQVTRFGGEVPNLQTGSFGADPDIIDNEGDTETPPDLIPQGAVEIKVGSIPVGGSPTLVDSAIDTDELGGASATLPGGAPDAGDVLMAWVIMRGATAFNTPAGYAIVDSIVTDGNHGAVLFWKIADGTETDTLSITAPGTHRKRLFFTRWTGINDLDISAVLNSQSPATSHSIGPVTPTAGLPALVIGAFMKDVQASAWTPGSGYTEADDGNVGSAQQPRGEFEYKVIATTSGSYSADAAQPTSETWAAILAVFVGNPDLFEWENAPDVSDGSDTTYAQTDQEDDNLRVDLGESLRIVSARLRVSTSGAGTRSFSLYGADDADFSDEVLLDSASISSAGSFAAQDIAFSWSTGQAYRYYRVVVGTADTYRYYALEMFPAADVTEADLSLYQLRSEKGDPSGYADLDSGGLVPVAELPNVEDLATAETDTDLRLAPDGAGGLVFASGGTANAELNIEGGQSVIKTHGSMGSTETIDPTDGNVHTGTVNADVAITLGAPVGTGACSLELRLTNDTTPGHVVTFTGSVTVVGTIPTDASAQYALFAESLDGGSTWVVWVIGQDDVVASLDDLTDVEITAPAEGDTLRYRSGTWINEAGSGGTASHFEVLMTGASPPEPVTTDDETDWIYGEVA